MNFDDPRQYRLGVLCAAASALAWSSAGLFIRSIGTDLMTMLFWRGIVSGTCVFLVFLVAERGRAFAILRRMRLPSVAVMVLSAVSMISGIGSMYYTTVADAMVIYATLPFVTAAFAFFMIGEKPGATTLIASALAVVGVLVMLMDGDSESGGLFGKFLAFVMTLNVAVMATLMRQHRNVPMMPAMAGSAWLCSVATIAFAKPLSVGLPDMGLIMAFGIVQNALGLVLYTIASRRIPAAEASLLTALEVPLTPFWVALFLGEMPSNSTLIGGPIVLVALFWHIIHEIRRERPALETSRSGPNAA
ncbi:DMT family transporter [Pseudomonas sp. R2.Fl]|nr:DMT family transporter [Pseudomonas sp. R2.Fl]